MIIGNGCLHSAIIGAKIVIILELKPQAPNTVELYLVGKYSEVIKKHTVIAPETPNFVNSKHIMFKFIASGGKKIIPKPKINPIKKQIVIVFFDPILLETTPAIKHERASKELDIIRFMYISPGMYLTKFPSI